MKVTFDYLDEFQRGAKALRKKYPSFEDDYNTFLDELEKNPFSGESLGKHTYKNRMTISSNHHVDDHLCKLGRQGCHTAEKTDTRLEGGSSAGRCECQCG